MTDSTAKRDIIIPSNCDTAPVRDEESLSASEYSQMLDSTDEGVVLIQDAEIKYVNSAITRLLGYSVEEIKGEPFTILIGPEHLELVAERYMARLQGEDVPSTYDITLKRKDDTIVSAEIHVSIFEHNNSPASLVMVRDITARLEREKALKENERNLRSLYNSMNEGVCQHEMVYDDLGKAVDYRVIDANQKYEEILNLRKEDIIGKLASEIYGTDEPPYMEIYADVAKTGQSTKFETYFPPMNKYFSISVFSPKKGKFATVFDDITQRKHAEENLKSKVDELEKYKKATINRELKMVELKEEIKSLKEKQRGG